jgi:hypothetical protein
MYRNSGWAGHAYMIVAGALVGFALILQFYLTANLVVAQGGHLVTAVLVFLDFFTILQYPRPGRASRALDRP